MHESMGRKARDTITGFSGTVTGYCEYISGCNQCLLMPPVKKDGSWVEGMWIDEQRVKFIGKSRIKLDNEKSPGPDKPAPKR